MKNIIIAIIGLIIIGNLLRVILTPILLRIIKENNNPYMIAHRRRLKMHIPCIIIRSRPQFTKKQMREFYYLEKDLELFQYFILKQYKDRNIVSRVPSLTDIVNKSLVVCNRNQKFDQFSISTIYIQYCMRYDGRVHPIRYNKFCNSVYVSNLIEKYAEIDFPEIKSESDVMIPLSYFAEAIHDDKKSSNFVK